MVQNKITKKCLQLCKLEVLLGYPFHNCTDTMSILLTRCRTSSVLKGSGMTPSTLRSLTMFRDETRR